MGIPGDYGPQNIPPTNLRPELGTYNTYLSIVQHLTTFFDRVRFPENLYPIHLTNTVAIEDSFEGKQNKAWINIIAQKFKGGKGRETSNFIVRIVVKEEEDWGYRLTMPLVDEVIRIFEAAPIFYDFTDQQNPVAIGGLFIPCIYEESPFDDDALQVEGLRITDMSFQVKIPRLRATFEVAS